MTQTVQRTTQKLIDLLPENEEYYRLDELRSWGFPGFVVERIKVELERNMAESMILPQTDWANIKSDAVQNAWQQFVQAIRAEARLPASYARAVIETAVADVIDMLTEPRKNIPDVIFGGDKELSFTQLSKRTEAVVVYNHFAALLPRYMQKKDMERLSKVRCMQVISQADSKLTAKYSPLNWAQTLAPLFELLDGTIDPSLLRLFFEDKDRSELAAVFEQRDEALTRAEFIEILSSPNLTNKKLQVETDEEKREEQSSAENSSEKEAGETSLMAGRAEVDQGSSLQAAEEGEREGGDSVEKEPKEQPSEFDQADTLDTVESEEEPIEEYDSDGEAAEEKSDPDDNYTDPTVEVNNNGTYSINATFGEAEQADGDSVEENNTAGADSETTDDTQESVDPIWMHFISEDENTEIASEEEVEEDSGPDLDRSGLPEEEKEQDLDEEPIIDLTESEDDKANKADGLIDHLSDSRDYFVESIFDGSEQAYEEAVQKIALFDDWRKASKYIQNDIFRRNLVDMYSESAVDFTDRLQDYFLEKEN